MEWIYKYFSFTAVIAGIGFLIKYLIQKKIDSYFNTKLENHKKELAVLTERSKYDLSRKLFDFEAYAIKKHTLYPELYLRVSQTFDQLSEFVTKWQENEFGEESDLDEIGELFYVEMKELLNKIKSAMDQMDKDDLFLSRDVSSAYWVSLVEMQDFSISLFNTFRDLKETDQYRDKINSLIGNVVNVENKIFKLSTTVDYLREVIYKELSYSHFEETVEKKA